MSSEATEERVLDAVKARRELVNDALDEDVPMADPERLYEATRYLLEAGGKRLRPTVTLLTAEALADAEPLSEDYRSFPALDGADIDVMAAAVSIEVIQSFTLIHDDIMDDDDLRRGVPAVHKEYDTETAILAGDTLYAKAFEFMTQTGADPQNGLEAVRLLATTCTKICEGQALDVEFERRTEVLPDEYLEMVELKTAVLYGAAAATAGVLMGADDETVEALYRYGIDSGCAFQIQDDVLDLTVPSEKLGKQRGSDLVENKETLITLHARQQGVNVEDLVAADTVEGVTEDDIDAAVAELNKVGSIDYARDKAQELTDRAKRHLEVLPDNDARSLLADISDYLISRGY
ncbi:geranylgeranylglyceryl diphosphate synthase [Halogeometricum borinquense DSM 11551]|uniref:Geranylgeranyl-diphosphate synthase farnesyl-diphosphate synthase n=2 Tax=Halogeometricum borinquense TaxID=60847 RepID=E4NR46_HALBP|nr:polyprenyl synthetase family protein [Halogeometricum borinquense]ADQ66782.1 geranylgeranyl-diphosphate synthase; farnesyl-diphosphate synthase [Halogeometricum borinquense DSM 11551]ELY30290.1 geranylgeranylglyceryl diphosphate synthase [Halogeometricum borinquense DSM 11551]RYJ14246.1 polyprenyl synthetase family protein [Halogeometricum borinquense]